MTHARKQKNRNHTPEEKAGNMNRLREQLDTGFNRKKLQFSHCKYVQRTKGEYD